jgi:F-type H+-transporting ATPase subunit a
MKERLSDVAARWRRLRRSHAFLMAALVVGVALIFGPPLLAQQDDERGHGQSDSHGDPAVEDVAAGHADDADHGEEGGHDEEGVVHPPTLLNIVADVIEGKSLHDAKDARNPVAGFLLSYKAPIYSLAITAFLSFIFIRGTRRMTLIPGRFQNFLEWVIESLAGFLEGVLGPQGRKFIPFLGTLFLYIYVSNICGLIPLGFTPTSMLETTASMAIIVFVSVQVVAVKSMGFGGYFKHLAGDPEDALGWALVPLLMPIHIVGELARPLSLSMRLFGNMMGEEMLLAVFMGMGVAMLAFTQLPVGFPLHIPFLFLSLLTTFIQALVFTVLSTIYFALVLPHPKEAH